VSNFLLNNIQSAELVMLNASTAATKEAQSLNKKPQV